MASWRLLGFDIGGTKIAVSLAASDGAILGSRRLKTAGLSPDEAIAAMVAAGRELMAEAGLDSNGIKAIGVGSPAPHDIPGGRILSPPNMKGWVDVPVRDRLAEAFGVETFFDNDANGGALAEWLFGSGKGAANMVYLTLSTGIGGGIIANSRLVRGAGFTAGEIGHMVIDRDGPSCNCGLKGCYEAFCGGMAIAQRLKAEIIQGRGKAILDAAGSVDKVDMIAFRTAVRAGDPYALSLWEEMCRRHAQAIGIVANVFNPEKIVLGTIAAASGELLMGPVRRHLPEFAWPSTLSRLTLDVTSLGHDIGDYAGVAIALNYLYERGQWELPWRAGR